MPSSKKAKQAIDRALALSPCINTIFELGSGWGGLAFFLAKSFPHAQIQAFEISYFPWLFSMIVQKIKRCPNLTLHRKNFFSSSLSEVDVVVCYLCPPLMKKLKIKFEKEMKPTALVISNSFTIPGWQSAQRIETKDIWKSEIIVYICMQNEKHS